MRRAFPQIAVSALGVWLMFAPAALDYAGTTAASSDRLVGPTVAAIGFVSASAITGSVRWLNLLSALWLIVAPLVLAFPMAATVNSVFVGLLVGALAPLGKPDPHRFGGGWSTLIGRSE